MGFRERIKALWTPKEDPLNMRVGALGERAARKHLHQQGLKFLAANFASGRGEIDLVFRDKDCLVFVEVKTRAAGGWTRPARAVDERKRRALSRCALDYVRQLKEPRVKIRFDVIEVLMQDGAVAEVRHLPNTFNLSPPYTFG